MHVGKKSISFSDTLIGMVLWCAGKYNINSGE